jgi:hypothetical protein
LTRHAGNPWVNVHQMLFSHYGTCRRRLGKLISVHCQQLVCFIFLFTFLWLYDISVIVNEERFFVFKKFPQWCSIILPTYLPTFVHHSVIDELEMGDKRWNDFLQLYSNRKTDWFCFAFEKSNFEVSSIIVKIFLNLKIPSHLLLIHTYNFE